ncbi:MaoC/PaaZ C-terminal domain-containing protein [Solibacillus sp. FSL W7-1472]|uniref:Acyl dehydratase n=2 Tax=Solibacillus TaxID=648800 RepID=F2F0M1_SOLSS|nr:MULTISPECIES: MaoC/PaaZ C-terminal domain-containing protein [Solibacillus]AMO85830.1 dehydratase [Solibacillus silvestris]EKB46489.1 (3R)-hydroxyacyl-ACP dehydratase subunit HadB [Solibacillus isronensis B3W22]MCM3721110.1 dehydratase [Solibacillus isronensis]OBW60231.1 dehydratase [Solibacillus silvestris]BAK16265.1 acyl dehydratase [Solibacillus silvestris StLB046]
MTVLADIRKGESLETTLEPVSRMDLIKYSGSSGDFNPIHTIDEEAKKAGLPGIIAHGMWTMGNLSKLFTAYYDEGYIKDYNIRFTGMVFLNDVLTLKADLVDIVDQSLIFDVKAINQHQKAVVKGKLIFERY